MKVIKIDPYRKEISEIDIEPTLKGFYKAIGCEVIERLPWDWLPTDTPHDLWIDEEGLLKPNLSFVLVNDRGIGFECRGRAIICGRRVDDEETDWCDHSADIEKIKRWVMFD